MLPGAESLPLPIYRAADVRELDRVAIQEHGIPGFTLMTRAGRATFRVLLQQWPEIEQITVYCGVGNNGGDGYVVATLAQQRGIPVRVVQVGDANKIQGDALTARERALEAGVEVAAFSAESGPIEGVVVDALLGTGLSGAVKGDYAEAIGQINRRGLPVIAVDIPSGLCSDRGTELGEAVRAQHTVTYIGVKQGLLTAAAPDCVGELHFAGLMVPDEVYLEVEPSGERVDLSRLADQLPKRSAGSHKGDFGHLAVVGGDLGMAGAALMASMSACRVGAGLVSCATRPDHVSALVARCPEVMAHGVRSGQEVEPLLEKASVIVVGPGLGRGPWGEQLLQRAYQTEVPMVVDADALNLLSEGRVIKESRENWILTPHPGEAARLLNCSAAEVQGDRFAAVKALQTRYGGVVILKGAGSLICCEGQVFVSSYGNPGMASGGMGDVLSGILGGLLAQGLSPCEAAQLGVAVHGAAADVAAERQGERGLMATDLVPNLQRFVNACL